MLQAALGRSPGYVCVGPHKLSGGLNTPLGSPHPVPAPCKRCGVSQCSLSPLSPWGFCTKGASRDPGPPVLDSPLPPPHGPGEGESPHTLTSAFWDRKRGAGIRRVRPLLARRTSGRGGLGLPLCPTKLSEQSPSLPSPPLPQWSPNILVHSEGPPPTRAELGGPGVTWFLRLPRDQGRVSIRPCRAGSYPTHPPILSQASSRHSTKILVPEEPSGTNAWVCGWSPMHRSIAHRNSRDFSMLRPAFSWEVPTSRTRETRL